MSSPRNLEVKGIEKHQARMQALWDSLSGETINYTKYMKAVVELGKNLPSLGVRADIHYGKSAPEYKFDLEKYKQIREFTDHFKRVWFATEVDRVQVVELDGVLPYYEKSAYRKEDKYCKFWHDDSLVVPADLKVGCTFIPTTIPEALQAGSAYYIRKDNQLFYIKKLDGFSPPEILLVSNDYDNLKLTGLKNHEEIDKKALLKIATETAHTHIIDQRQFTANFDLNRSTQKQVTDALRFLDDYYFDRMHVQFKKDLENQGKNKKEAEENQVREEVKNIEQSEREQAFKKRLYRKRKEEEQKAFEEFLELDKKIFKAIKNYTTLTQDIYYGIGWGSGILTSILVGFVQGGNSLFSMLGNLSLYARSILAYIWGGLSTAMQWKAYRWKTAGIVRRYHGKDGHLEGLLRYNAPNGTGMRELAALDKFYLFTGTVIVGLTSIGMGALSYNSLYNLPVLLGIFGSFAIPPLGMSIIILISIAAVAYNSIYMFMEGYENLLKKGKGIIAYLTDPFFETCKFIDEDKSLDAGWEKNTMKVLAIVLFIAVFLTGVGGLVISGMTMSHSIAKLSDNAVNSGPQIAKILSKMVGVVSAISRFIFTMGRGNDTAKAVMNHKKAKIDKAKLALAVAGGVQSAVFFASEDPLGNSGLDALGGSLAGSREIAGQVGGLVRFKEASRRECDFFMMRKVPNPNMLGELPGANAAYIVVPDKANGHQLYYINKREQTCELVEVDSKYDTEFRNLRYEQLSSTRNHVLLSSEDRREIQDLIYKHTGNSSFPDPNCSLLYMNVRTMNLDTIKSLINTKEAYIRIELQEQGGKVHRLLHFKENQIIQIPFGQQFAKKFDKQFAKKMEAGLQSKALTAKKVRAISKMTHQYLHPTNDAEEFRFERVRQQVRHRFFYHSNVPAPAVSPEPPVIKPSATA